MAKSPKIEVELGAQERFERTVRNMLNTPPKPFTKPAKKAVKRKPKRKAS
jgi:hypothetical protein